VLGDADKAIAAAATLLELGFLVNPVAFPALPLERGGVRFSSSRSHTEIDIRDLPRRSRRWLACSTPTQTPSLDPSQQRCRCLDHITIRPSRITSRVQ